MVVVEGNQKKYGGGGEETTIEMWRWSENNRIAVVVVARKR